MIIDFHTHVFSPQVKKNRSQYIDSDPCFATLYAAPNAKLATADELVASMDEAEIAEVTTGNALKYFGL